MKSALAGSIAGEGRSAGEGRFGALDRDLLTPTRWAGGTGVVSLDVAAEAGFGWSKKSPIAPFFHLGRSPLATGVIPLIAFEAGACFGAIAGRSPPFGGSAVRGNATRDPLAREPFARVDDGLAR